MSSGPRLMPGGRSTADNDGSADRTAAAVPKRRRIVMKTVGESFIAIAAVLVCPKSASAYQAPVESPIYVDIAQEGPADGSSWATAFPDLQDALAIAPPGCEIWVAGGEYHPDKGTGKKSLSFDLPDGVAVYGGFSGTESSLEQRDRASNATILSGDLLGNDQPGFVNMQDNSFHVVRALDTLSGATLDGCSVTG